jgi:hypothetical protein
MISNTLSRKAWRRKKRKLDKKFCLVYALQDSQGNIRYIGQTRLLLRDRLKWFYKAIGRKKRANQRMSPVEKWIDHLLMYEIYPQMILLDGNATWDVSEILWIERYRVKGAQLLNVLRGGNDTLRAIQREDK